MLHESQFSTDSRFPLEQLEELITTLNNGGSPMITELKSDLAKYLRARESRSVFTAALSVDQVNRLGDLSLRLMSNRELDEPVTFLTPTGQSIQHTLEPLAKVRFCARLEAIISSLLTSFQRENDLNPRIDSQTEPLADKMAIAMLAGRVPILGTETRVGAFQWLKLMNMNFGKRPATRPLLAGLSFRTMGLIPFPENYLPQVQL